MTFPLFRGNNNNVQNGQARGRARQRGNQGGNARRSRSRTRRGANSNRGSIISHKSNQSLKNINERRRNKYFKTKRGV